MHAQSRSMAIVAALVAASIAKSGGSTAIGVIIWESRWEFGTYVAEKPGYAHQLLVCNRCHPVGSPMSDQGSTSSKTTAQVDRL